MFIYINIYLKMCSQINDDYDDDDDDDEHLACKWSKPKAQILPT